MDPSWDMQFPKKNLRIIGPFLEQEITAAKGSTDPWDCGMLRGKPGGFKNGRKGPLLRKFQWLLLVPIKGGR